MMMYRTISYLILSFPILSIPTFPHPSLWVSFLVYTIV